MNLDVHQAACVAALVLLSLPVPARAADGELVSLLTAHKVVAKQDQTEAFVEAKQAKFGDIIEYRLKLTNRTGGAVAKLRPVLPIPRTMEYLPGTAVPGRVEASVDGKDFKPAPLSRRVTKPDGKVKVEKIPYSEYRQLRWNVGDLATDATVVVKARVKVKAE